MLRNSSIEFMSSWRAPGYILGIILLIVAQPAKALDFDESVVPPEILFGSGNLNGGFTVDQQSGIELGLRAKLRFDENNQPQNVFNSKGDGTYTFAAGAAPTGFGFMPNAASTPIWSFEWSVNTDFDDTSALVLDDLTYEMGIDFDPGIAETNFLVFDPISPSASVPFYDHAIGTNASTNPGATAGDGPTYAALLAANNVAQNSWNMEFFNDAPYNTFVASDTGRYDFYIAAFNGAVEVARTEMAVLVVAPTEVNTDSLSDDGWYSDDTRADGSGAQSAGTNLISPTLTDAPENGGGNENAAHDADILNQIAFTAPPVPAPAGTHPGSIHLNIAAGAGGGKSQISHRKDDGTGHAPGSVFGPGMSLEYSWMGDGTSTVTASVKFGFKTAEFASAGVSTRTGENAWDKVLIYEPGNLNGGTSDGTWQTETVDYTTGKWWFFDRVAGAGTIGTPLTLSDMSTSAVVVSGPKTIADVYALITAPGAHITSVQFGIGSGNAGGSVYVNQLETNFYRSGSITTFGPELPVRNLTQDLYYPTIQSAITAATSGDVIEAAPGTYSENIVLNKSLTLLGSQAAIDARGRVAGAPDDSVESVITAGSGILLTLQAGCAMSTIDGFAFSGGSRGIESSSGPLNGVMIVNNHFEGQSGPAMFLNDSGIDVTIHQNVMIGSSGGGTVLHMDQDNFDGLHLTCNHVTRTGLPSNTGWFVDGNRNIGTSVNRSPLISQNEFTNHGAGANIGRFAIEDAEISENLFGNNSFDGLQGGPANCQIVRNSFVSNDRAALRLTGFGGTGDATRGAQGNLISENFFDSNGTGASASGHGDIRVDDQFDGTQATNTILGNSLGSAVAIWINETSGELINASGNWIGANSGPTVTSHPTGTGGGLLGIGSSTIDFTPWLDSGTDTQAGTSGFQGDFSVLHVDDDSPQSGASGRIQEGLDLVSGSTVNIAPGTYVETGQVLVNSDVTIVGDAGDRPIIMTDADTGSGGDARGMWLVDTGVVLDVSNLIFDGTGRLIYQAIRHKGSGSVTNCDFREIKFNESGPTYAGVAIAAFGDGPTDVIDCTMQEVGRVGILYFGTGVSGSICSGLTYTGKGVGDFLDYALDISAGATITVDGASISGNRGVASSDGSTSAGILVSTFFAPGTTALIQNSVITDNTTGVFSGYDAGDTSSVTASFNQITGNDNGVRNTSATTVVNAEFNYWGSDSGPTDPDGVDEADSPPCFDPSTMVNADGTGDSVDDLNVDYCPWLFGQGSLVLELNEACPDDANVAAGYQIEVELWMRDLLDPATGFQAFVTYDNATLTYRGDLSSYTVSPFPTHIGTIATVDSGGLLSLNSFEAPGGGPGGTTADSLLATLVFDVDVSCSTTGFAFDTSPASELSFEGVPLMTGNVDSQSVTLDDTAPVITPGIIDDCYPTAAAAEADALSITAVNDNCAGAVSVSAEASGTCSATVTVLATDACGNVSMHEYNTRIDDEDPTVDQDPILPCYPTQLDAENAAMAATTGMDNCTPEPQLVYNVVETSGGCDKTITVRVTDQCGNSTDVQYMTRVDNTMPTVTAGVIASCYPNVAAAEAAAIAATSAVDDCPGVLDVSASTTGTCSAIVTVTVTDSCGNSDFVDYNTRIDDELPVVVCSNVTTAADASDCSAEVTLSATATDNCDVFLAGDITFTIDNDANGFDVGDDMVLGSGMTYVFPSGTTNVRASATDFCGNVGVCDFSVTVDAVNLVNVSVVLNSVAFNGTRNIRFTAKGPGGCAAAICWPVTFADASGMTVQSIGSAQIEVPCGDWDELCAKDEQHTLIDTVDLVVNGVEFDAVDDPELLSGDTDNDSDVDINDVTLFIAQFGMAFGGPNACPYDNVRDADFSLNGVVAGEDFSILQPNWLLFSSCVCPAPVAGGNSDTRPTTLNNGMIEAIDITPDRRLITIDSVKTRLDVRDLRPEVAMHADLNGDGEITFEDIRIFENDQGFTNALSDSLEEIELIQKGRREISDSRKDLKNRR